MGKTGTSRYHPLPEKPIGSISSKKKEYVGIRISVHFRKAVFG